VSKFGAVHPGNPARGLPARRSGSDLVYYNSVGLGVQDAAAALAIVAAARDRDA
jgi:ornithine cyclodeaminase/alanine dehydrogenase-like protein (mu-crystallin family)